MSEWWTGPRESADDVVAIIDEVERFLDEWEAEEERDA
jgi:hypothetical protein